MVLHHFVGTKIVKSKAMTRQEYISYRGWELPADEDGGDQGYLVEYLDGGKPNHPDHQGYISWAPKEQHENAYLKMGNMGKYTPEQQRVFAKKVQLENDIATLKQEINDLEPFHVTEWEIQLMVTQLSCMEATLNVITERTEWF
jgi:hypothetical protein